MKRIYVTPSMYMEQFIAEHYVAASTCGTTIKQTPDHGHIQIKNGQVHCAFTSSNCGPNATSCLQNGTSYGCTTISGSHQIITKESGTVIKTPTSGHNCHILSTKEAAMGFAQTYKDEKCGDGVARLYGLKDFDELKKAWS